MDEETESSKDKLTTSTQGRLLAMRFVKSVENSRERSDTASIFSEILYGRRKKYLKIRSPRQNLKTFSDDSVRNRKAEDKRVAELKGTKDLIGRRGYLLPNEI